MVTSISSITPARSPAPSARLLEFDLIRGLCCLGVVLIHVSGYFWGLPAKDPSLRHLVLYATMNETVRFALFGFMFLSGALLTIRHGGDFRLTPFLSKRVHTVLLPYLAWVVIYFLFGVAVQHSCSPKTPLELTQLGKALHGSASHLRIVAGWMLFGTWPHLYFINMLFQMYLLYALAHRPLLWALSSYRRACWFVVLSVASYPVWVYLRFIHFLHPDLQLPHLLSWVAHNPNRVAIEWLVPFAFGLYYGAYHERVLPWARRNRVWCWAFTLCMVTAIALIRGLPWLRGQCMAKLGNPGWPFSFWQPVLRQWYAGGLMLLALPWAVDLRRNYEVLRPRWLQWWLKFAAASFGVYLAHPVVLELLRVSHISRMLYAKSSSLYLVGVAAIAAVSSYYFVQAIGTLGKRSRVFRWLPKILFGG